MMGLPLSAMTKNWSVVVARVAGRRLVGEENSLANNEMEIIPMPIPTKNTNRMRTVFASRFMKVFSLAAALGAPPDVGTSGVLLLRC